MFVEFFYHIVQFDFAYILEFVLLNLHWIFAFFALSFIFFSGKNTIRRFFILFLVPWIWFDFTGIMELIYLSGTFLTFYYIGEVALMKFAEDTPQLADKLIWVEEGWFITTLIVVNFIL